MSMGEFHEGVCFCGGVRIRVEGAPVTQGYCHCADCRGWSAAPVTAYALWPLERVTLVAGADRVGRYSKTEARERCRCRDCGGAVMSEIPGAGLVGVFVAILDGFAFTPEHHVNYGSRVIDMPDGAPKYLDTPVEAGGSGRMVDA